MTGFWELLHAERNTLLLATAAHLDLVLESLLIAVAAGVPLGILATRAKWLERSILGARPMSCRRFPAWHSWDSC